MDPDDVLREFERLALDEKIELDVDDAIAGLAVLLADPCRTRKGTSPADRGGRDALQTGFE